MEQSNVGRKAGWSYRAQVGAVSGALGGFAVFARDALYSASYADVRSPGEFVLASGTRWFVCVAIGLLLGTLIGTGLSALSRLSGERARFSAPVLTLAALAAAAVGVRLLLSSETAHLWLDIGIVTAALLVANPRLYDEGASAVAWCLSVGLGVAAAASVFFAANSVVNDLYSLALQIHAWLVALFVAAVACRAVHKLLDKPVSKLANRVGVMKSVAAVGLLMVIPGLALSAVDTWLEHNTFERRLAKLPAGEVTAQGERPNVILISVDTLRADYVGFLGGPARTPTFDALADESYVFEQAHAVAPWTRPSFAAFFSGLYPHEMGIARTQSNDAESVKVIPFRWREDRRLMAEILRDEGYATAAVVTNGNLSTGAAADQGFELFHNCMVDEAPAALPALIAEALGVGRKSEGDRDRANVVTALGERVVSRGSRPLFLWLHYMDPHWPYDSPDASSEIHARGDPDPISLGASVRTGQARQRFLDAYAAEVEFADRWLQPIIDGLRDAGLWDSSVVVFWSDHGEEFWEHDEWGHGHSLNQPQLHVPLTIRLPAQAEGRRVSQRVSLLDVMPTLLELCGVESPPENLRGRSLVPVLHPDGGDIGEFRVFLEGCSMGSVRKGLMVGRYKLIYDVYQDRFTLYDLERDPQELYNIWGAAGAPDTREWEAELIDWTEISLAEMARLTGGQTEKLCPETLQRLRDMGYIQ